MLVFAALFSSHMSCSVQLRICKPAYSELVPEPGNRDGCCRKGIQCKMTLGCMTRLTLALVCVAAAGQLVVIQ